MRLRRNMLLFGAALLAGTALAGCPEKIPEPDSKPQPSAAEEPEVEVPKELVKEDIKVGTGPEAKEGDTVKVHYTGRLLKTKLKFDSSEGKDPLEFTIGDGDVIKGWDLGVVGMKVGGKRKLTIPADLAYGQEGSPPKIPADAPLVFDVELVAIEDKNKDGGDTGAPDAGEDQPKDKAEPPDKAAPEPKPKAKPEPKPKPESAAK